MISLMWLDYICEWFKGKELDERTKSILRQEWATANSTKDRIQEILDMSDRRLARQQVKALAEEMYKALRYRKEGRGPELSPEEAFQKKQWKESLTLRSECTHLKGAVATRWGVDKYGGPKPVSHCCKDYNVSCHTFINGTVVIKCLYNCGFESRPGDENWEEAERMFKESTNDSTSSEIPEFYKGQVVVVKK
jgi:hypothetical protein